MCENQLFGPIPFGGIGAAMSAQQPGIGAPPGGMAAALPSWAQQEEAARLFSKQLTNALRHAASLRSSDGTTGKPDETIRISDERLSALADEWMSAKIREWYNFGCPVVGKAHYDVESFEEFVKYKLN